MSYLRNLIQRAQGTAAPLVSARPSPLFAAPVAPLSPRSIDMSSSVIPSSPPMPAANALSDARPSINRPSPAPIFPETRPLSRPVEAAYSDDLQTHDPVQAHNPVQMHDPVPRPPQSVSPPAVERPTERVMPSDAPTPEPTQPTIPEARLAPTAQAPSTPASSVPERRPAPPEPTVSPLRVSKVPEQVDASPDDTPVKSTPRASLPDVPLVPRPAMRGEPASSPVDITNDQPRTGPRESAPVITASPPQPFLSKGEEPIPMPVPRPPEKGSETIRIEQRTVTEKAAPNVSEVSQPREAAPLMAHASMVLPKAVTLPTLPVPKREIKIHVGSIDLHFEPPPAVNAPPVSPPSAPPRPTLENYTSRRSYQEDDL